MKVSLQHIHIMSKDKLKLARWYADHLGFQIIADIEAMGEKNGPIYISADDGKTALSIFTQHNPEGKIGVRCIPAFAVASDEFIELFEYANKNLGNDLEMFDHIVFFSFYLFDPEGTKLEFTSDDYEKTKLHLEKAGIIALKENPATRK